MGANVIEFSSHKVRRSISCYSLPALGQGLNNPDDPGSDSFLNEEEDEERKQMYSKLRARKEALQDALEAKMSELKALCLREAEITGELPPETPRRPNEPVPIIRRRVRTEFALNDKLLTSPTRQEDEVLAKLELEFEIQSKIVAAQMKLMNEVSGRRGIRKKRKASYEASKAKLDMLEKQLLPLRHELEETRKSKAVKRHLIQEMTMKQCPVFDTVDSHSHSMGNQLIPFHCQGIGSHNGIFRINSNGRVNGGLLTPGILTNNNGQPRSTNDGQSRSTNDGQSRSTNDGQSRSTNDGQPRSTNDGQSRNDGLVSALTSALSKDGNKKRKKQVRIKESNSTPSSPVIVRSDRARCMSGFADIQSSLRSSLRANDLQSGPLPIVDGFGHPSLQTTTGHSAGGKCNNGQPFSGQRLQNDIPRLGLEAIDVRGKYDHLTREDIPNLNFIPMSPAKRRLMKTQAQRASMDSGRTLSGHGSFKDQTSIAPLSKHASIDAIECKSRENESKKYESRENERECKSRENESRENGRECKNRENGREQKSREYESRENGREQKSRHNSEGMGKVLPRNPPPPVPHSLRMAQRPLPPTPVHGHGLTGSEFPPFPTVPSDVPSFQDSLLPMVEEPILPDVVDCGTLRKCSSSSSSVESDLMPPPPSLPPKVSKKVIHRPSPLTIPESISSCDRNSVSHDAMSVNGSLFNHDSVSNHDSISNSVSTHDSISNRGSIAAESFMSIEMPSTPSYIPRPEVETPRPGPVPVTPTVNVPNADIVSLGQFQPYWEETKPYELADFYKYSTKHRRQRQQSAPSDQLTDTTPSPGKSNSGSLVSTGTESNGQMPVEEFTSPTRPAVAGDFCDEMLDWYDGHLKNPTVV